MGVFLLSQWASPFYLRYIINNISPQKSHFDWNSRIPSLVGGLSALIFTAINLSENMYSISNAAFGGFFLLSGLIILFFTFLMGFYDKLMVDNGKVITLS